MHTLTLHKYKENKGSGLTKIKSEPEEIELDSFLQKMAENSKISNHEKEQIKCKV